MKSGVLKKTASNIDQSEGSQGSDIVLTDQKRLETENNEEKVSGSDSISSTSIKEPKTLQRRNSLKKNGHKLQVDEPESQYMLTRYVLFYADDIVQQGILTKSEVQY